MTMSREIYIPEVLPDELAPKTVREPLVMGALYYRGEKVPVITSAPTIKLPPAERSQARPKPILEERSVTGPTEVGVFYLNGNATNGTFEQATKELVRSGK